MKDIMFLIVFLTLFCSGLCIGDNGHTLRTTEAEFLDGLLEKSNYDKRSHPPINGKPIEVTVEMFINSMSSLNEISMDYNLDIFLRQTWRDTRLLFPANSTYNSTVTFDNNNFEKLWVPDLFFTNMKGGNFHDITTPNRLIRISPGGQVLYSSRLTLKLACDFQLYRYPLDNQTCFAEMETYGYSTDMLIFRWKEDNPVQIREGLTLPEFAIEDTRTGDCTTNYVTGSFSCIYAELHLQRLFNYYLIQVFVPSILILVLSWMSFWIDYAAVPARISIGLLTVLTITTQASGISSKLPRVSYIKAIDVWMFTNMVFVFSAMIEYAIVNVLARKHKEKESQRKKGSGMTINGNSVQLQSVKKISENGQDNTEMPYLHCTPEPQEKKTCLQTMENKALLLDFISRFAFPLAFIVFNALYWPFYVRL